MDAERRALAEEHLPLVEHLVGKMASGFPRYVDRQELVAAGTMGLVEAALRYDEDRGVPFARYATRRIRGAILDLVRSTDWVPRSVRALSRRSTEAANRLTSDLGRAPTDAELAAACGVEEHEFAALRGRVERGIIDHLNGGPDGEGSLLDRVADQHQPLPDEMVEGGEFHRYLRAALDCLPERHRTVVVGLYLENRSFDELAELLGVTPSRISQLRSDALTMMREGIEAQWEERQPTERPKGRVAIRRTRYASDIARTASLQARAAHHLSTQVRAGADGAGAEPASGAGGIAVSL